MKLITSVKEMRVFSGDAQRMGRSVVFVPTMGYLHDGHASLLKKGRSLGDMLVMSIFVNPVQFGPGEDFASYPGDLKRDLALADVNKVHCVFNPAADEMYPEGFQTFIEIERLSSHLCGLSRPGHFRGVATVVMKLFNIVKPDIAIFGEKDFQQTAIIKRMIRDFNMDIDIVSMPIVRDADGLAMSSRNSYLNKEERIAARCLYAAITRGRNIFNKGIKGAAVILKKMKHVIESEPLAVIEYIKICDTDTLEDLDIIADMALLVLSVKIGKTRLIDNCILQSHDRFKL
ncbi:MAG TPA: pantoate--beta-alanine ligase [Thermodesulfobacteriota bacterium]|nr:pantoate--beta-alanine ligase [Thermodesulfobacteriota bacterium]